LSEVILVQDFVNTVSPKSHSSKAKRTNTTTTKKEKEKNSYTSPV